MDVNRIEDVPELDQEEMSSAAAGGEKYYRSKPYCKACGCEMASLREQVYRCRNTRCSEFGKDKTAGQVDWG